MPLVSILSTQLRLLCERALLWVFLYTDGLSYLGAMSYIQISRTLIYIYIPSSLYLSSHHTYLHRQWTELWRITAPLLKNMKL